MKSRFRVLLLPVLLGAVVGGCGLNSDDEPLSTNGECEPVATGCSVTSCSALCECQGGDGTSCERACSTSRTDEATEFERRVLDLTNEQRAAGGCCGGECFPPVPALELSPLLSSAAQTHALDMADNAYFSHDGVDGRDPFERMMVSGYQGCAMAENIARGSTTPEEVVSGWIASSGHCANMLSEQMRFLGVGFARSEDEFGYYWVQNFGG